MTRILSQLVVGFLDNGSYAALHEPFGFQSDVLKSHGLKDTLWAPTGFVFDFESTPNLIRGPLGENKRGGAAHDICCRIDVCPGITKSIAADVYFEIMSYCDSIDFERFKKENHKFIPNAIIVPVVTFKDWSRRWLKSTTVRIWPGNYFQVYKMDATAKEIYGMDGDPYCTVEKIEAAIVQSEQAVKVIKDIPVEVDTSKIVKGAKAVIEDLNDKKDEIVK